MNALTLIEALAERGITGQAFAMHRPGAGCSPRAAFLSAFGIKIPGHAGFFVHQPTISFGFRIIKLIVSFQCFSHSDLCPQGEASDTASNTACCRLFLRISQPGC